MRKILSIGLVALAVACGSGEEEHPIQYQSPRPPTTLEQGAVASAELSLAGMLQPALSTEPTAGAPGLADQLAVELGAYATYGAPATSAKLGGNATSQAFDASGMPPECVSTNVDTGTVTWTNCEIETTTTDELGNPTTLYVKIHGSLTSAGGTTSWSIQEWMTMTAVEAGGQAMSLQAQAVLDGNLVVTPTRISGYSHSSVFETINYGFVMTAGLDTRLTLDVGYQADPFCVVSGGLTLTQVWTERPMGATHADAPDLGWVITWTGCNQYTIAPGQSS